MIKSNSIPIGWVTHKLENNDTKEVLPLLWGFWAPHQASQPEDPGKVLGIPRKPDHEASRIWWQDFHKTEGNRDSTLQRHKQNLCAPRLSRKEQCPHCRLNQSVQFSYSVVSDSWRPHESQHARPPCPSPIPEVHSDSHPSRQWRHPAISSFVIPFSSCSQSLPASVFSNESTLHMRWPKYWSFSFSISPSKEIPGFIFRMDWLDLLVVQGTLKSLLQHHSSKASILRRSAFFTVQLSHPYTTTGKTIALTRRTFVSKVMSLLFNMLSRLVITFLPRSKHLLISWLQSPSAVILEPQKIKSDTVSTVSPSIFHEVMGPDAMILIFWMLSFKPTFSLSTFTFIKRLFSSSSLSAIGVVSSAYLRWLIFLPAILIPACASYSPAFLMMYSA